MAINTATILGRITAPLELRLTPSGTPVLQFTVAVDRDYTKQGEERQADFINCVAWRQTADFISRYFDKGRMIALTGRLQSRTYDDKSGSKHYVTELIIDKASFTGEAKQQSQPAHTDPEDSFGIPDEYESVISDDGVPF